MCALRNGFPRAGQTAIVSRYTSSAHGTLPPSSFSESLRGKTPSGEPRLCSHQLSLWDVTGLGPVLIAEEGGASSQGTMTEFVGCACRRRRLQGRPDPRQAVRNGKRTPRVTSAVLAALAASFLASAKAFTAVPQLLHLRNANLQARGPQILGRCRCSGVVRLPAQKDVTDDDLDIPRPDTAADLTPGYEWLELDDEIDWEFLEKMERNSKYMMPPIDPLFLRYDHERFREYYEEQPMLLLGRALATASGVLKVLAAVGADIIGGGLTPIDAAAGARLAPPTRPIRAGALRAPRVGRGVAREQAARARG